MDCFLSENLVRKYIKENKIGLTKEASSEVNLRRTSEQTAKNKGNVSIQIRRDDDDLNYLSMDFLANLFDKKDPIKEACLARDANEYKPLRDAMAHTSLLADKARLKLAGVYENIKGRIRTLLTGSKKRRGTKVKK